MRTRNLLSDSEQEEQEDGGGDDESLQAIRYSGMLRKKKEDHGMFEDPYKTMCMATLDDGILTLKMIVNGEVTDSQEMYNLGDGWKLIIRDDKKDRFSLIRSSGSSSEPTQVRLTKGWEQPRRGGRRRKERRGEGGGKERRGEEEGKERRGEGDGRREE
uniref:Uncharacterized protein n=1 Tax=Guillardia theta TaxID=55529 RepID=A0A7S4H9Q5_GUITH|mmetsp:Transcript_11282/g.38543  ORF Transcript_11282/g.38543 Transcript_11282/m.38543 type:complete len:159 (+) Transcript_11282:118-594(+)